MGLSTEVSCEAGSFSCCCNPHRFFSLRGFEVLFPHVGNLGYAFCLGPQLFLLVYPTCKCGTALSDSPCLTFQPPIIQQPPSHKTCPTWLPISASLDECSFFNSLVVGLPYSLIFWQFWLIFVFKSVVVLLLVVQGGTVYPPMPPSWPEV